MDHFSVRVLSRTLSFVGFVAALGAAPASFNVRDHGAVGDGTTLCTAALQRTIDRAAEAGGGTVWVPAGTYLTGTLELRNNITLHLEPGATLLGSTNPKDYPIRPSVEPSYTDNYVRQALIAGENLRNVGVRGGGTIDGNGAAFRWKEYRDRPYAIRLVRCTDVVIEGIALRNSAMWMQHYLACDRVRIQGIRVFNHATYNNDGIDIDGCHDVAINDCMIDSDDDALCLKSTLDRACENVTVTNCVLSSHANAFKMGTESNGGFKNVTFSNCVILSPRFSQAIYGVQRGMGGIALEIVDGGHLENIAINNVTIRGINVPIFLRLGNRARPIGPNAPKPAQGTFRNVTISNIVATAAGRVGCSVTGLPGAFVENVTLSNLHLEFEGGGKRELADREVPERAEAYPESRMFGDLPAYGLYFRHARGVSVRDVRLATREPDARHAVMCDDVTDLEIANLSFAGAAGAAALVRLNDVADAVVRNCRIRGAADTFMKVAGAATDDVVLSGNDSDRAGQPVEVGPGVPRDAVRTANGRAGG